MDRRQGPHVLPSAPDCTAEAHAAEKQQPLGDKQGAAPSLGQVLTEAAPPRAPTPVTRAVAP